MVLLTAFVLLIAFSAPAHAYIDPGSGSYLLQLGLAGVLAVAYAVKLSWRRLKAAAMRFLGGNRTRTGDA